MLSRWRGARALHNAQILQGSKPRWQELEDRELPVFVYKNLTPEHVPAEHVALGNPHRSSEQLRKQAFDILQIERQTHQR